MSIPRDAWWAKWERAEELRQFLADEIDETFADEKNCVRLSPEHGAQANHYLFRVTALNAPPLLRWALIIGDAVNNYRAALDHLAWRLALIHSRGVVPDNTIVFPIYDKPRKFRKSDHRPSFDSFHWAIFEEFQPYKRLRGADGWSGEFVPQLALIRSLSNRDKHQRLTPMVLPPTRWSFPKGLYRNVPPGVIAWDVAHIVHSTEPLELGAVAMSMSIREPGVEANMDVECYVAPSISLPRYGPVIPCLTRLGNFVRRVLAEFDPLI